MKKKNITNLLNTFLTGMVLLGLMLVCSGCGDVIYQMDRTIPNRAFDMPRISNKGTTLFVNLQGSNLKGYVTKTDKTQTVFTLSVSANTKFAWMVTPGDAAGNGALGCIVCAVPAGGNSFTMKYALFDIERSVPTELSTITGVNQSGVTNIVLATNRKNSVVAAWDVVYVSDGNPISRYAILNAPDGGFLPRREVLDLVYPDNFFAPTITGSTPPRIALDDNNILCGVQGGKVGAAYSDQIVGVLQPLLGLSPAMGAYRPGSPSAAVTVKSCSSGFYMLASTHLATEASQVQNTNQYLRFGGGKLEFPTTLSTVETVKVSESDLNTVFTRIDQTSAIAVVASDLVETTVANNLKIPTSGIFISTLTGGDINVSQGNILKIIQNDVASPFNSGIQALQTASQLASNTVIALAISSTQNFSNWVAVLTSSSPARVQVYSLATGELVLDQEVTTSSIANSIVEVNPQGDVVVVYEDTNGNVFSEVFEVGENPYSKLQQSLKQFSPFKLLPGMR